MIKDVPFPHENKKAANQQFFVEAQQKGLMNIIKNVLAVMTVIGVPVGAFYWAYRS